MPTNGSGVYSKPSGSTAVPQTTIESVVFNAVVDDIAATMNLPRPIVSGGTGSTSAPAARTALGLEIGTNVQAFENYATITALRAVVPTVGQTAFLTEDGRAVRYVFRAGDYAARIAADPQGYEFVKADTLLATFGAWVAVRDNVDLLAPVEFFDILRRTRTPSVVAEVRAGTFMGDLAVEWQAFRDALHAQFLVTGRATGRITECTIRSSVAPNFAIDRLTLETQGRVYIIGTGVVGFFVDGTGLGYSGFGVVNMTVGDIVAGSESGPSGIIIKMAHFSKFGKMNSRGGFFAGIVVDGCIVTSMRPYISGTDGGAFLQNPAIGLYITKGAGVGVGQTSWCVFNETVTEDVPVGIFMEDTFGCSFIGGVAERCTNKGLEIAATSLQSKFIGFDMESNTNFDIDCRGKDNQFIACDSGGIVRFTNTAKSNRIMGGHYNTIDFGALTETNTVTDARVPTITDASTGARRNRVSGVVNFAGDFVDGWIEYTPALGAQTGAFITTSTIGAYKILDGDTVHFRAQVTITDNGTAAGSITLSLPFPTAQNFTFSGVELALTARQVGAFSFATSSVMRVVFSDGTYPGANGRTINVTGTYQRQ